MYNDTRLVIHKKTNLTQGQKKLLELMMIKIDKKENLEYQETREIWLNNVKKLVSDDGRPMEYCWWIKRTLADGRIIEGDNRVMDEYCVRPAVYTWLVQSIGALVLKGYLTVLPTMKFYDYAN